MPSRASGEAKGTDGQSGAGRSLVQEEEENQTPR